MTSERAPGSRLPIFLFLLGVPIAIGAAIFLVKSSSGPAPAADPSGADRRAAEPASRPRADALQDRLSFARQGDALTPIAPARSLRPPADADAPMALQSWSSGAPRIMAREWSDRGAAIEEHCFFSPSGDALGCGALRDGERWEGVFVQWAAPPGKPGAEANVLREIVSYREGQKDGLARAYRFDGTPMLETLFSGGQQVAKRVFRQGENEIVELGAKRLSGLPASRRTRNTQN